MNGMFTSYSVVVESSFFAFSLSRQIPLSLLCLVGLGFSFISTAIANNTLIQTLVREEYRGRVMSLFVMGNMGFGPLGSLCMGRLADMLGPVVTTRVCAVGVVLVGVILYFLKKGFMPEIEEAIKEKGL